MKSIRRISQSSLALLLSCLFSPAFAVVTYDGTAGVYQNIFFSNSVQSCTSCHSSTVTGDDRYGAPVGVDFNTHALTQLANPYYVDGTTVAEGAYNRIVVNSDMPAIPGDPPPTYTYTYSTGLNSAEKALVTAWSTGGFLQRAAPEVDTWAAATSLGKYAGTIWTKYKENENF